LRVNYYDNIPDIRMLTDDIKAVNYQGARLNYDERLRKSGL
jgi:hypothetical protein